ncbi:TPA: hypothetical protein IUX51_002234 [Enterococcus faecalis]|nr:hypothetical protein [Enterococcus faecalis]EPH73388.1 hypothetical protein D928_00309 [Enterococcus faecalis 20-SD-BW-06]EPI01611.1 hypothetical protein D919_01391 [Enterococcus faecalis 20-SD-BW-08]EHV2873847.1 hypothetical protein [Enterococcus faecalis]NSO30839.1 hypothetical protein [Enterococcus faecalis]
MFLSGIIFLSEVIKMFKSKKDTYRELSDICNLTMKNIQDIENGSGLNIIGPFIENDEYNSYLSILKTYSSLGNTLLNNWETFKFNDLSAFFSKLDSYIEFLSLFIENPTIENQLKLTTFYNSLEELNRII